MVSNKIIYFSLSNFDVSLTSSHIFIVENFFCNVLMKSNRYLKKKTYNFIKNNKFNNFSSFYKTNLNDM